MPYPAVRDASSGGCVCSGQAGLAGCCSKSCSRGTREKLSCRHWKLFLRGSSNKSRKGHPITSWHVLYCGAAWHVMYCGVAWHVFYCVVAWHVLYCGAAWHVLYCGAAWHVFYCGAAWHVLYCGAAWHVLNCGAAWHVLYCGVATLDVRQPSRGLAWAERSQLNVGAVNPAWAGSPAACMAPVWRVRLRCGEQGSGMASRAPVWRAGLRYGEQGSGMASRAPVWRAGLRYGKQGIRGLLLATLPKSKNFRAVHPLHHTTSTLPQMQLRGYPPLHPLPWAPPCALLHHPPPLPSACPCRHCPPTAQSSPLRPSQRAWRRPPPARGGHRAAG
eukprot:363540-Chlamydomonas_euryale.AAC.4